MWRTELLALCLSLPVPQAPERPPAPDALSRARVGVDAWLGPRAGDEAARCAAAHAVATAGKPAVRELAERLATAREARDDTACAGLLALVPAVGVEVLRRELATGFVYAGQYAELRALLPEISTYFVGLVLEPPDWLAPADRAVVVNVLRDLHERSPGPEVLARLRAAAAAQPPDATLLRAIACALAQWGNTDLADEQGRDLEARAARGSLDDRLSARQQLAQLHYELRDPGRAAEIQLECLRDAEAAEQPLLPTAYYNATCFLCLAGRGTEALQCLERCLARQRTTRPSLRVQRQLFEHDPELEPIRGTDRFRELMRSARN